MSPQATLSHRRPTTPLRGRRPAGAATASVPGVVRAVGELDLATTPGFRARLLEALERCPAGVVVDLSQVSFADCRFVGALVAARNRAKQLGRPLTLRGTPPRVARLLKATGTYALFPPTPDRSLECHPSGDIQNLSPSGRRAITD
ncbi:STAS domain-containing protein, partial [Streptacidiphilus neutrinimicus]|uniref:STAS domain-containing protein n=1 Tax=Streptacidiphilus neutrinimicus TaxID=105420 RepID=UPI00137710E1